jgi:lipoprotein-releasing system permease protein
MPFELQIALRYLLARRKQAFISVISFISALGVTIGVMALVIALALMTGLQQEVRDRILGSNPHVFVWKVGGIDDESAEVETLRRIPEVLGAAPAILGKALIDARDSGTGTSAFVTIKGIDPAREPQVTDITSAMRAGRLESLTESEDDNGIVLGTDLARQLGVGLGDSVLVMSPEVRTSPLSGLVPRFRRMTVVGTFSLGLFEFDSTYGLVTMETAKRLFNREDVELIQLRVADMWRAPQVAADVQSSLGPSYITEHWQAMNERLFSALWIEKVAIGLTIGLIVMVAALNIIASLVLLVMEKHRDIAILKTMGASARSVMLIFMAQGLIIGIVGTLVGATLGYVLSFLADRYEWIQIPMDVYQVAHVPFVIEPLNFALVIVAAVVICFLATIYPSRQAARLNPAQALRYE